MRSSSLAQCSGEVTHHLPPEAGDRTAGEERDGFTGGDAEAEHAHGRAARVPVDRDLGDVDAVHLVDE